MPSGATNWRQTHDGNREKSPGPDLQIVLDLDAVVVSVIQSRTRRSFSLTVCSSMSSSTASDFHTIQQRNRKTDLMVYFLITLAALGAEATASPNWTGFLANGTNRTDARNLPLQWSPDQGVAWQVAVPGYGQSTPVVWGNRVFVTSIQGENKETCLVHAFDLESGTKLWTREIEASQTKKNSNMVSRAAPTPVVDGDGLYVFYESGDVAKFSHQGEPIWKRSLVKLYGEIESGHGLGSSLAQTVGAIIVLVAHDGPSYLLALDKTTGETVWKTDRESRVSWTSPTAATVNGKTQIIVSSNGSVTGYEAEGGKLLWTLDGIGGNTIPSASVAGDHILVGAGVSRRNKDAAAASRSNCCLKLTEKEGVPGYEVVWNAAKATSSYATPLAHRGYAYFVNKVGVVYCLDLATGKQHYAQRIDGACWASPLGAGDHVYFFTKKGTTTVLKAGPKFEKVAASQLWVDEEKSPKSDPSTDNRSGKTDEKAASSEKAPRRRSYSLGQVIYGVAAVDGSFVIRTGEQLYCVRHDSPARVFEK